MPDVPQPLSPRLRRRAHHVPRLAVALVALACAGCPSGSDSGGNLIYNNMSDPTNDGASFIGSAACSACHPGVAAQHRLHGHANMLTKIEDGQPTFPPEVERAGGFPPPPGKAWSDIAYVIGGYLHRALYVNLQGYVLTDGVEGVNTQWNLDFLPSGTAAGFAAYEADRAADNPQPYSYDCFRCHVVGPMPFVPDDPMFQDNRMGAAGSFFEPGVQCEACHGPGSNHIPNPQRRDIFVDPSGQTCISCHAQSGTEIIHAARGFIAHNEQAAELAASGAHARFTCLTCHAPHSSTVYDRPEGIRNDCTACHPDQNLALHQGAVYRRGDYVEPVTCQSCHMPFASLNASVAAEDVVGADARVADIRTHIFRINPQPVDFNAFFTADGTQVALDEQGRAAVTLDFVCLRCHNGIGNAFLFMEGAADAAGAAEDMHQRMPRR